MINIQQIIIIGIFLTIFSRLSLAETEIWVSGRNSHAVLQPFPLHGEGAEEIPFFKKNNLFVTRVSAGESHSVVLARPAANPYANVTVYAFGLNSEGQLGTSHDLSTFKDEAQPKEAYFFQNPDLIDGPIIHAAATKSNTILISKKRIYAAGTSRYGLLGKERAVRSQPFFRDTENWSETELPEGVNLKRLHCGWAFCLILTEDHQIYGYGDNTFGQINPKSDQKLFNTVQKINIPFNCTVQSLKVGHCHAIIHCIGAGQTHSLIGWGCSTNNQLNTDKPVSKVFFKQIEPIKKPGCWNYAITAYCAGSHNTIFVQTQTTSRGTQQRVVGYGSNMEGQFGVGAIQESNFGKFQDIDPLLVGGRVVETLVCGLQTTFATLSKPWNGRLLVAGENGFGQLSYYKRNRLTVFSQTLTNFQNEKVKEVSSLFYHTLFLTTNGRVYSSGKGDFGQLGKEDVKLSVTAEIMKRDFSKMGDLSISFDWTHMSVTSSTGNILIFGDNEYGQLGVGTLVSSSEPQQIPFTTEYKLTSVKAGQLFSIGVAQNNLFSMGQNNFGKLGLGFDLSVLASGQDQKDNTRNDPTLVQFENLDNVPTISKVFVNFNQTFVLFESGQLWSFGRCGEFQLGRPYQDNSDCWIPQRIPNVTEEFGKSIQQISLGARHGLLLSNNKIFSFGSNHYSQLGRGGEMFHEITNFRHVTVNASIVEAFQTGEMTSFFSTSGKTLYSAGNFQNLGRNSFNNPSLFMEMNQEAYKEFVADANIIQILIGELKSFFLLDSGKFFYFENEERGIAVNPFILSGIEHENVTYMSARRDLVLALTQTKKVYSQGRYNEYGQLGQGTLFTDSYDSWGQIQFPDPTDDQISHICAGTNFGLAITTKGSIYGFGNDICGVIVSDPLNINTCDLNLHCSIFKSPQKSKFAGFKSPVVDLKCFTSHAVVLLENGEVHSWGDPRAIGRESSWSDPARHPSIPAKVEIPEKVIKIDVSEIGTAAITALGKAFWFGTLTEYGPNYPKPTQIGWKDNLGLPFNFERLKCGFYHCFFIGKDSSGLKQMLATGDDSYGQLGLGYLSASPLLIPDTTRIAFARNLQGGFEDLEAMSVTAGYRHSFAIATDGRLFYWGSAESPCPLPFTPSPGSQNMAPISTPQEVPLDEKLRAVSCSFTHCIAAVESDAIFLDEFRDFRKFPRNFYSLWRYAKKVFDFSNFPYNLLKIISPYGMSELKVCVWGHNSENQLGILNPEKRKEAIVREPYCYLLNYDHKLSRQLGVIKSSEGKHTLNDFLWSIWDFALFYYQIAQVESGERASVVLISRDKRFYHRWVTDNPQWVIVISAMTVMSIVFCCAVICIFIFCNCGVVILGSLFCFRQKKYSELKKDSAKMIEILEKKNKDGMTIHLLQHDDNDNDDDIDNGEDDRNGSSDGKTHQRTKTNEIPKETDIERQKSKFMKKYYKESILDNLKIKQNHFADYELASIEEPQDSKPPAFLLTQFLKTIYIPFKDLKDLTLIGEGSQGIVCSAIWKETKVAVKLINTSAFVGQGNFSSFEKELNIMLTLNHNNIIALYGACVSEKKVGIVMELGKTSLDKAIARGKFTGKLKSKVKILLGIAEGFCYLALKQIIHRDLKPENILLTDKNVPKITDFGVSKWKEDLKKSMTMKVGTSQYLAPEVVLETGEYDEKCDVFSYGILTYQVVFDKTSPYPGEELYPHVLASKNPNYRPKIPENYMDSFPPEDPDLSKEVVDGLIDMMRGCWQHEPQDRPTFNQVQRKLEGFLAQMKKESKKELKDED